MSCILPESIKKLQAAIKEKGGPKYLRSLSSSERVDFFAEYVDSKYDADKSNANLLNRQVESKMLLPSQTAAIQEWLRNLPKDKRTNTLARDNDVVEMVKNSKTILSPKDGKPFMESLVKQRLGFEASVSDTKELVDFANTASQHKKALSDALPGWENMSVAEYDEKTSVGAPKDARDALGNSLLEFKEKLDEMAVAASNPIEWSNLPKSIKENPKSFIGQIVYGAAGALKAAKASLDISFLFRQLSGAWFSNPASAARGSWHGIQQFGKSLVNADARRATMAELMTRPNALNGNYDRFGLEIGINEEAFAVNPIRKAEQAITRGKFNPFTASDDSFSVGLQWTRAEMFDAMWENTNGDAQLLKAQDVGGAINEITGRGALPTDNSQAEKMINLLMFSPRWLSSRIRQITNLRFIGQYFDKTPNGLRAKAAVNNTIFMLSMAAMVILARNYYGDEEDLDEMMVKTFDPRSADFLNAKVGNLHVDLSSGVGNFIRFASRFATGRIMTGEGAVQSKSRGDILMRYILSKQSPLSQQIGYGFEVATKKNPKDFQFNPIGWKTFAESFMPISANNLGSIDEEHLPETVGQVLLDVLGVSAQYWSPNEKNEGKSSALVREQERLAFRENARVGSAEANSNAAINTKLKGATRERANSDFTRNYTREADRLIKTAKYKRLNDSEKKKALSDIRAKTLREINKKYRIRQKKVI